MTLAKRLLTGDVREGATTGDRIRNAERAAVEHSEANANRSSGTEEATG